MGVAFKNQGEFDMAIETFKKALLIKPNNAQVYYNMGNTYQDHGKMDEAIEYYNKSISHKPNSTEAYNNMGSALKIQCKFEDLFRLSKKHIYLNLIILSPYTTLAQHFN